MAINKNGQRARISRSRNLKQNLPTDSMIYAGQDNRHENLVFTVIWFGQDFYEEREVHDLASIPDLFREGRILWLDLNCVHHHEAVEEIGKMFNLHYLTLEDVQNTDERAKFADFEHYLILLMKMIYYDKTRDRINYEQVSFVFGDHFLITFQEFEGDAFADVRRRLQKPQDIIRTKGTDYLAYCLANAIVDGYYSVLDVFTDTIEDLELELSDSNKDTPQLQKQFHLMRYEIMLLQRAVQPLLNIISRINTSTNPILEPVNKKYILDISDHINQISEGITNQREMLASLQDIHMANMNQKMNEVMKTLTLVTTIFIPLSFIAGVYGMNFEYMPELKNPYAYAVVWAVMIGISFAMVVVFYRKKWL